MMKRGDAITLTVERFGAEGKSVARVEGFVVFIPGGIPGDTVTARITRVSKNFAEAQVMAVQVPSALRTQPRCAYYGTCGGCSWQHLSYAGQCEFKRQQVVDALERIGGFTEPAVHPTLGAANEYYYRNKMEFSFGVRWLTAEEMTHLKAEGTQSTPADQFALGLHIPRRFDRVLDLRECHLQSVESATILNAVRDWALAKELTIYSTFTHTGYLRNLVIRETRHTDQRMVNLVTSEERPALMDEFRAMLLDRFPSTTTIVNNITDRKSQVALGDREVVLHGPGWITERIGTRSYRVSANSFFQTNTLQAERLYDTVRAFAALKPHETAFDLYSGTGTIALHVADDAGQVIGVEAVASAVEDARRNAETHGVTNCRFVLGDLKDRVLDRGVEAELHVKPDVVICDPPRAGMHPGVVASIRALAPARIVYVSCNPATQARDLKLLCDEGLYDLRESQPVDMFPHTNHVENVASLTLHGGS
ncbi:MAG: 23S rRNA (uracil(1939)-C(5))-methyltransferase RlmD [Ignavibacteriae bacterium]|nr:23S rRNA (uracil(1939)-C(5))-methyltransferase RlmD [Ignavibacteriota bacterium]